jgi:hypothetical protein
MQSLAGQLVALLAIYSDTFNLNAASDCIIDHAFRLDDAQPEPAAAERMQ